jgi:hypothetical protein
VGLPRGVRGDALACRGHPYMFIIFLLIIFLLIIIEKNEPAEVGKYLLSLYWGKY